MSVNRIIISILLWGFSITALVIGFIPALPIVHWDEVSDKSGYVQGYFPSDHGYLLRIFTATDDMPDDLTMPGRWTDLKGANPWFDAEDALVESEFKEATYILKGTAKMTKEGTRYGDYYNFSVQEYYCTKYIPNFAKYDHPGFLLVVAGVAIFLLQSVKLTLHLLGRKRKRVS